MSPYPTAADGAALASYCEMQIAVPAAVSTGLAAALAFFTVHDQIVLVPGLLMNAWTKSGLPSAFEQAPPAILVFAGHVAVQVEVALLPELWVPVQVT